MFLLRSSNKVWKVYYVTTIWFMNILGQKILELWIFACAITLWKTVHNHSGLDNRMLFASHTSNTIVFWLNFMHIKSVSVWRSEWYGTFHSLSAHVKQNPWKQPTQSKKQSLPILLYGYKQSIKQKVFTFINIA